MTTMISDHNSPPIFLQRETLELLTNNSPKLLPHQQINILEHVPSIHLFLFRFNLNNNVHPRVSIHPRPHLFNLLSTCTCKMSIVPPPPIPPNITGVGDLFKQEIVILVPDRAICVPLFVI